MRHGFALFLIVWLSACGSLPPRAPLTPALPERFVAGLAESAPPLWWQALGDAELDGLIKEALGANPGLQQIAARLRAARAGLGRAGADVWPQLNLTAEQQKPLGAGAMAASGSVGLAASYEIDLWGRIQAGERSAGSLAQATAHELKAAQISLSANIATQWIRLGSAHRRLALVASERQHAERILDLIKLRFRKGQVSAGDVLRQRQLLESTRALEALSIADLGVLEHGLAELLGRPAGVDHWAGYQNERLLPLPAGGVPAEVVSRRPDVQQAWQNLLAADADVAVAVAQRFPRLTLGAATSSTSAGPEALFDSWLSSLSASLLMPLVDGGRLRAEVQRREALRDQQLAAYRAAVLKAFREIQDVLLQDRQQQAQLDSLQVQLGLSAALVQRQLRELRGGDVDYPAVLDGQITHSALRRELQAARQRAQEIRITMYRVTAGPLPESVATGQDA